MKILTISISVKDKFFKTERTTIWDNQEKVRKAESQYSNRFTRRCSCPTRIRTSTDRIKICCTTFILWDKKSAKVRVSIKFYKLNSC